MIQGINQMEADQPTPESMKGVEHVVPVERVTAPTPAPVVPKTKDPKKVAAGRAGAVARRARQESLLAELRAAKEAVNQSEAAAVLVEQQQQPVAAQHPMHAPAADVKADWTPWLLFGGAGLAVLYVFSMRPCTPPEKSGARQQEQQHPEVSQPPLAPRRAQQLNASDPFVME